MNGITHYITAPFDSQTTATLRAGDMVFISGIIYGARDAAHNQLIETLNQGQPPPIPLENQVIYYVGPAPASPGHVIGPAGPTTSGRMDPYTPSLLAHGVKALIGKGYRSDTVKKALVQYQAVYLAAVGGAAALLAQSIISSQVVAYAHLGPEAIFKFKVEHFPAIVVNDIFGGDAYALGKSQYARSMDNPSD